MPTNQRNVRLSEALLREEDPAHFRDILEALEAEFQPSGSLEKFLVREMACAHWRLRRAYYKTLQTLEKACAAEPEQNEPNLPPRKSCILPALASIR